MTSTWGPLQTQGPQACRPFPAEPPKEVNNPQWASASPESGHRPLRIDDPNEGGSAELPVLDTPAAAAPTKSFNGLGGLHELVCTSTWLAQQTSHQNRRVFSHTSRESSTPRSLAGPYGCTLPYAQTLAFARVTA